MQQVCITGASRGIGHALARHFLEAGDEVVTIARSGIDHPNIVALQDDFPDTHCHFACDLNRQGAIEAVAEAISQRQDCIDLLINNAGVNALRSPEEPQHKELGQLDGEALLRIFRINAIAPLLVTQAFLPLLQASRRPRVIMISSASGSIAQRTTAGTYSYGASKAALNMITRNLSAGLGAKGPIVCAVHPGHVQTEMSEHTGDPVELCATELATLSSALSDAHRGAFISRQGDSIPW